LCSTPLIPYIHGVLARELAADIVQQQAKAFVARAQAGQWDQDPEEIHQARVASRRLRAALRVFKAVLPEQIMALQPELKWIAGLLGTVRDMDVQIQRLRTTAAELEIAQDVVPYGGWLDALRDRALGSLDEAVHTARFAQLVNALEHLEIETQLHAEQLTVEQVAPEQLTVEQFAPARLRRTAKKLRKQAQLVNRAAPDIVVHRARIRAKRLRYATEFFEPVYGKPARRLIRATTEFQDLLGDHQDGVVNTAHVHEAIATAAAAWPAETSLALGKLVQWEAQHRAKLRGRAKKVYGEVEDAWRTLGKAL